MPKPEELDEIIEEGESEPEEAPDHLARVRRDVWRMLRYLRGGATVAEAVTRVDGWTVEVWGDALILTQTRAGVDHRWTRGRGNTSTSEAALAYGLAHLLGQLTTVIAERRIRLAIEAGRLIATVAATSAVDSSDGGRS